MEGAEQSSRLVGDFLRTFKNYAILYVLGIFTFLISFPVSTITGTKPDFGIVLQFGYLCGITFALIIGCMLGWKLVRMILVEKPDSPSRAMIQSFKKIVDKDRMVNTVHMLISVSFFMVGFAVLKGAIAVLNPFEWDVTFKDWDRIVHFGKLPHEWLGPLFFNPYALGVFNVLYNTWFIVMIGSLMAAGINGCGVHMQYLVSFALAWLFGGFFLAVAETVPIWALPTQEILWEGYNGERDGSAGISAFPSMHVGTAALIAIYATRVNFTLAVIAWVFCASIMLGSVVLGWHYAVDGYGGFVLAIVFWKIAGVLTVAREQRSAAL